MKPLRPLAVFAHPDDESFAVVGTPAKYAAAGIEVVIVSATRGEAGIKGGGGMPPPLVAGVVREGELVSKQYRPQDGETIKVLAVMGGG